MDFVKNVVSPLVGPILGFLVEPVCTNGAYAFQYKNHVQQLEEVNNRLRGKKERIQGMVDTATNKGEVIETEVSNWLEKVEQMEGDITNFLNQPGDGESFRCFQGCICPNLMWRYKRGRKAKKKKLDVSELISRGELLQTSPVARDASFEPVFDSSQYYTTFQSRASVVDEIRNALKDSGDDMIGVHGPGGAGKTTMVKEVAKEAKELGIFDEIVIAVVSKDPNTSKLQEELASQLGLKCEQRSEIGRAEELRKALLNGKRKILVILDDLWQGLGLNAIGIPTSGLGNRGCKILLTSRNEEVFRRMEVRSCVRISCVRLKYLEEQETWELFKKVIDGDFPVNESTARKVSKRCGDLPVAIVAVGAALKGKEEAEWQDALHQLEKCRIKYIQGKVLEGYTPLKLSYDFLKEEDAKSCFLLCCLFPEDAEIPIVDLVRYSFALGFLRSVNTLKFARYRVQAMVNTLKTSCLLLNGENKNFVKMHDVIRDLAISITEERQIEHDGGLDWPGKQHFMVDHNIRKWPKNDAWEHYTAISLRINVEADIHFPYCPLMQTLVLKRGECSLKIPNDFFQGMEKARVLDLENISTDLPSSVFELDHLRMLRLNNCHYLGHLSTIRNLKNHIEILSLDGSTIEKLPQEIGNLTRLRSLDLRVFFLQVIPKGVISNLIHLEELYVTQRFKNWDTTTDGGMSNASIGELKSLNQLTVLHVCISTNSYKIMVQECRHLFEKLINFAIFINIDIFLGNGSSNVLEIIDIDGTHDEFCLLMDRVENRVEKLRLCHIQGLRYLSGEGSFCKLIDLQIFGCHSMKYLVPPSCPQVFQQLKTLTIYDCCTMEQIIGEVGDYCESSGGGSFCKLIDLKISGCHSMKYLFPPSCPQAFQQLKTLYVYDCRRMEQIIGGVGDYCKSSGGGSFCKLIDVRIFGCDSMKYLFPPSCPQAFQQLKTLEVHNCHRMEQIIGGVGDHCNENEVVTEEAIIFSRLERIKLSKLPQFRSFCPKMEKTAIVGNLSNWTTTTESIFNEKVFFPVLEELTIDELSVKDIWNKQMIQSPKRSNKVSFSQLKKIEVIQCRNLVNVFPSNMLIRLQNLETLCVRECLSLILLVDEDLKPNIQSPTVKFKLTEVFPKLRDLYLDDLPKLMKIWPNDEDCCSNDNYVHLYLRAISIRLCDSLTHAFSASVARHLASIEELYVIKCFGMEVIVSEEKGEEVIDEGIIEFCQLKTLKLEYLPNLRRFYQSKSEASHLFNHQVIFPKIKYLYLGDLKSSKEIRLLDLLGTTQEHLHTVNIFGCQVSTKVSFHHQKRRSGIVDNLLLQNCQGFKHFIDLNGTISIGEEQFADVKKLKLCDLPELMVLWNKNLHEIGGLRSLKEIIIINCSQLRSLFTHSMAMTLQQLKMLIVTSCEMMEEIIIIEENNINFAGKEMATHHIEFPKLKWLILDDLPNLKNFCNDERGSFSFSSLHTIVVQNCPKMKTFAFGQICLPPRMIKAFVGYKRIELEPRMEKRSVEYRRIEITNLNAFFEYWNADNNCFLEDYSDKDEYYLDADIWNKYDSYTFNKFYPRVDISSEDYYADIAKLFKRRIHFPIGYLKEEPEA